jgi:hypothetical protein
LIPLIFFPRVVTPRAGGSGRLDGLAVDTAGARFGPLAHGLADPIAERVVDPLPEPRATPLMEVAADGALGGEVMRQGRPSAAGTQEIEGGVEDGTQVGRAGSARRDLGGQHRREDRPLLIAKVAGIRSASRDAHVKAPEPRVEVTEPDPR